MNSVLPDVTFVVTPSNPKIFHRNFLASPCVANLRADRVILQEGYPSASLAYNDAIDKANTDLVVFAHQDVYFPEGWLSDLNRSLNVLERLDPDWGVLGGYGVNNRGLRAGFVYSVGLGVLGAAFERPVEIDTLDEYFLIVRKSSGLRFDRHLPNFHFYGTDICMTARERGKRCYAISAFSVHNTSYGTGPAGFFEGYWYIKKKWKKFLPIQTSCIRVTRWNEAVIIHHLKQAFFALLGRDMKPLPRLEDPRTVLPYAIEVADRK